MQQKQNSNSITVQVFILQVIICIKHKVVFPLKNGAKLLKHFYKFRKYKNSKCLNGKRCGKIPTVLIWVILEQLVIQFSKKPRDK